MLVKKGGNSVSFSLKEPGLTSIQEKEDEAGINEGTLSSLSLSESHVSVAE